MNHSIRIKKGLDIPLEGAASGTPVELQGATTFAVVPDDFPGYVWKARVKAGDTVKAGEPLLADKETGEVALVSPVAGEVKEIRRGERRKIMAVVVERKGDGEIRHEIKAGDRDSLRAVLKASGLWAMIRQRPYDIVADPVAEPRDIFVTSFDSAPLAGPAMPRHLQKWLEKGLETLAALTSGKVWLSVRPDSGVTSKAAEVVTVMGPHPAGNVGVQIANINPVNKGETVWALDAATAARIGRLAAEGIADFTTEVAVTGPALENPASVITQAGVAISEIMRGFKVKTGITTRIISGNVLTGERISPADGFLRWPYRQITVIDEGEHADEFMGWASLDPKKYSVKRTFLSGLAKLRSSYPFDARIKGGHRAMIMSGEFDRVFPMDIYPEYLLKAIMARDIDRMEKLGVYEVAPEDFALPEFVDTSKEELQKTVREGLDYLRKELG